MQTYMILSLSQANWIGPRYLITLHIREKDCGSKFIEKINSLRFLQLQFMKVHVESRKLKTSNAYYSR